MNIDNIKAYATTVWPYIWKALTIAALAVFVWPIQYAVWVPTYYIWKLAVAAIKWALGLGVLGIALICIPVIGWLILLVIWLVFRNDKARERRHQEVMVALGAHVPEESKAPYNPWKPWALSWLTK